VVAQFAQYLGQLIDALARVVGVGVNILGTEVPPLKAVNRTQVTLGSM